MVQRTFFQRFGTHGVCVLPDDVLSDDPLTDPETGEELPSLRDQVSLVNGTYHHTFCYVRVLRTCGDGLYWADVAATPDMVNTYRVILTEEDLYFALPYDVRVQGKSPAQILKMMAAHARAVRPVQRVAPVVTPERTPAPVLPLEPLAVVEVSNDRAASSDRACDNGHPQGYEQAQGIQAHWFVPHAASLFAGHHRRADDAAVLVTVGARVSS